jgi:hypothetical protein
VVEKAFSFVSVTAPAVATRRGYLSELTAAVPSNFLCTLPIDTRSLSPSSEAKYLRNFASSDPNRSSSARL